MIFHLILSQGIIIPRILRCLLESSDEVSGNKLLQFRFQCRFKQRQVLHFRALTQIATLTPYLLWKITSVRSIIFSTQMNKLLTTITMETSLTVTTQEVPISQTVQYRRRKTTTICHISGWYVIIYLLFIMFGSSQRCWKQLVLHINSEVWISVILTWSVMCRVITAIFG